MCNDGARINFYYVKSNDYHLSFFDKIKFLFERNAFATFDFSTSNFVTLHAPTAKLSTSFFHHKMAATVTTLFCQSHLTTINDDYTCFFCRHKVYSSNIIVQSITYCAVPDLLTIFAPLFVVAGKIISEPGFASHENVAL